MTVGRMWRGILAGVLGMALLQGVTAAPAGAVPVAGSLSGTPKGVVVPHEEVHLRGSLPPRKARPVQLQARVDTGAWRTVAKARSKPSGSFAFTTTAAATAGTTLTYRVLAPATRIAGTRLAARRTPVVSYRVLQATGTLTVQRLVAEGGGFASVAQFAPARPGRPVSLQGWDGSAWLPLATGVQNAAGQVGFDVTALTEGSLRVRAVAARWRGAASVDTPAHVVHVQPRLDAGVYHACQVGTDGSGMVLGLERLRPARRPLPPPTAAGRSRIAGADWVRLSGGVYSTCGLKLDGSAWCWGSNYYGQLGDGTGVNSLDPVQVPGRLDRPRRRAEPCLRHPRRRHGRGAGGTTPPASSVTTRSISGSRRFRSGLASDWVLVDAGYAHTCGLRADGTAWCWGSNGSGRLGDGSTEDRHAAGAGGHRDRLGPGQRRGVGHVWGPRRLEQPGAGGPTTSACSASVRAPTRAAPVQVGTATDWMRVAPGTYQTCGVRADGTPFTGSAWCWGLNNDGQLGNGVPGNSSVPVQVASGSWSHRIVSGSGHVCALAADTSTWCWGANTYGQVGDGTSGDDQDRSTPTLVTWP